MDDDDIDWGIKMLLQENRDLKFKFTTLEAENAKLKALVERLVDCGDALADLYDGEMYPETAIESRNWRALVAEYQASKDGGGE